MVAAVVAVARIGRNARAIGPVSGQRLLDRNLRLARLGARGGGRYALHRARRTFASAERKDELDSEFQIRTAEDVTASWGT